MSDSRVFSGYTETMEAERTKWYENLNNEQLEWEDLAAQKSTNNLLRKLKTVPIYRYLLNYLLYTWERREDRGEKEDISESEINELIMHVVRTFRNNHMPEEKCTEAYVRRMLTTEWSREWDSFEKAASNRIFELGLGLGLPAEDVEELLQKAVKRAGFNYYNPEEMLVYCSLRFCTENHYTCFQVLLRDYKKIEPVIREEENVYFNSTAEVKNQMVDALANSVSEIGLYSSEDFRQGTMNPNVESFFARHKAAVPEKRTAAVIFMELYHQFTENHEKDILDFKAADRSTEEYAETVLKIEYDADQEISLPAGTLFYAVKGKEKKKEKFVLEKNVLLPRKENVEAVMPVQGVKEYVISLSKKQTEGYVKKGEKMVPVLSDKLVDIIDAYAATTIKYTGRAGEKRRAAGEICVVCYPGTFIPSGTLFSVGQYDYETRKNCTANAFVNVKVRSVAPSEEGVIIAKTGEIRYMEEPPAGILSVSNKKPVRRKETTQTITTELFRDFLYINDAERLGNNERQIDRTLLGSWFMETEITSKRFSDIQRQAEGEKNNTTDKMEHVEARRCDIITMAFLNFCMDTDSQPFEECVLDNNAEEVYKDFLVYVNKYLRACGMMPFYLNNPYECLLAYLIQTDTPVDSLRNMWKIANVGKEK